MNALQQLVCRMKIGQQDLQTLHHYLIGGKGEWLPAHEMLNDFYEKIGEMTDDLVEIGLSVGVEEPNIQQAVNTYTPMAGKPVGVSDALTAAYQTIIDIADMMQEISNGLDDEQRYIQSQMDSYIYDLRKTAEYKLKRAII